MSKEIDCTNATVFGDITAYDQRNASMYSQYKWFKKRCDELKEKNPNDFIWVNRFTDGSTSYYCPPGLTGCYEGSCFINSETECNKNSVYPFNSDPKGESNGLGVTGTKVYLEWRKDRKFPQNGFNFYIGNSLLRQWCASPGSEIRGEMANNKAAFYYNTLDGNCYLSKKYCEDYGDEHRRGPPIPDLNQINTAANPTYAGSSVSDLGGQCYTPPGQAFAEEMFGKTMVRFFKGACDDAMSTASDRRYKDDITLLAPDYGGKGINLYTFIYKDEVKDLHPDYKLLNLGFLADEVQKVYPEIVEKKNGMLYITITKDKLKDKKYWRIYNTLNNKKVILNLLLNKINKDGPK